MYVSVFACMFFVTFLWQFSHFTITRDEVVLCFSPLVSFDWICLKISRLTISSVVLVKQRHQDMEGRNTYNISRDVCPFDCPAGSWQSATGSHATQWHRFSSASHYLGRYARGEDDSSVFLQLLFFPLSFLLSPLLSLLYSLLSFSSL